MKITPVESDLTLADSSLVRSSGLHLSTIYNDMFQDLEPKRFVRGAPMDLKRLELGMSLETELERALVGRLSAERPGEFRTKEGIAFSPDLLIYNGTLRLGEIKLTWLSSREVPRLAGGSFPNRFDKFFVQMKGYCHNLDTPSARLYTFFVNGDYRGMTPELLAWDIEFTARELQENWDALMNHARHKKML